MKHQKITLRKLWAPLSLVGLLFWASCAPTPSAPKARTIEDLGQTRGQIDSFQFVNQDSQAVTIETVKGKVFITDFFFTSCPTICPKMKKQMLRVYKAFEGREDFEMISHSIDTKYDTVEHLKAYSQKLGVPDASLWHFVTGEKAHIYDMAKNYLVSAVEDEDAPGGYTHSGYVILMDKNQQIRGHYNGTDPISMDTLMMDIALLLEESK